MGYGLAASIYVADTNHFVINSCLYNDPNTTIWAVIPHNHILVPASQYDESWGYGPHHPNLPPGAEVPDGFVLLKGHYQEDYMMLFPRTKSGPVLMRRRYPSLRDLVYDMLPGPPIHCTITELTASLPLWFRVRWFAIAMRRSGLTPEAHTMMIKAHRTLPQSTSDGDLINWVKKAIWMPKSTITLSPIRTPLSPKSMASSTRTAARTRRQGPCKWTEASSREVRCC